MDAINNNERDVQRPLSDLPPKFPWSKIVAVLALLFLCFVLQVSIWSIEFLIQTKQESRTHESGAKSYNGDTIKTTLHASQRFTKEELYTSKRTAALLHEPVVKSAAAYWNQAVDSGILDWEYDIEDLKKHPEVDTNTYTLSPAEGWQALERAAQLGHPRAQLYVGNSITSGFTFCDAVNTDPSLRTLSNTPPTVANETSSTPAQASLYWHTAAINFNVEAALNMAHQLGTDCSASIPYRAAAAHATIDALQFPRFSVRIDRHTLYQLHARSTGHSPENRPDESLETLQFFALRASDPHSSDSANAAYTLARYYHSGIRGIPVNATAAAVYYRQAAEAGHWEAAGKAGMLYLWGWGVKQNVDTAYSLFQKGLGEEDYSSCLWKTREKLRLHRQQKNTQADAIFPCDPDSLNGMGLLHMLGGPVEVDWEQAEKFFSLSREQGNADAAYNLAMMKLGWKTHYAEEENRPATAEELFPVSGNTGTSSPTLAEYKDIVKDLTSAAVQGQHVLARHRLALLYENGVTVERKTTNPNVIASYHVAVKRDCPKAQGQYQAIIDSTAPGIVKRMRRAYEYYVAGDLPSSLKNYLVVAETGHEQAQVNAAFLLEQGVCLGLERTACAKAAVRLWKAAADQGSAEASLRVGDFYYYGRFRHRNNDLPFQWVQYVLYPEEHLVPMMLRKVAPYVEASPLGRYVVWRGEQYGDILSFVMDILSMAMGWKEVPVVPSNNNKQCAATEGDVCLATTTEDHSIDDDLSVAARYYRLASERSTNPRALFNMGFMYQFGLGLKQDFPLAKRQYDLAIVAGRASEANVPVSIALYVLNLHERWLKVGSRLEKSWEHMTVPVTGEKIPPHLVGKSRLDVVKDHLFSLESLAMVVLTVVLSYLLSARRTRR